MLPLNQSEQIGVWMLKFHQLKKYLMANEVGNTAKTVQALLGRLDCLWYVYAFISYISSRKKSVTVLKQI